MPSVPVWVWTNSAMYLAGGCYLWWRLVGQTTQRGTVIRIIGTVVVALIAVLAAGTLLGQYTLPMRVQRVVGWPGWTAYGFIIFTACTAFVLEPVRLVRWWRRRRAARTQDVATGVDFPNDQKRTGGGIPTVEPTAGDIPRRLVFERVLAGGIVLAGTTLTGISLAGALGQPRIRRQTIAIRELPAEAVGTRIALISDLHVGSLTDGDDCRRIVDLVNAQSADIVCLAGDFSDGDAATLGPDLAPLAGLRSTAGTFFVTGNHEFYFDADSWLQYFPTIGVRVLANESVTVRGLLLAGTHDIQGEAQGHGPDVSLALQGRQPGQPAILLSHNPVVLDDAIAHDVDLLLAGHTHGGQFYPGVWIVGATTKAFSGYYAFGDTQVFVTNGCRFWGPPARIGAPMDITVLDLVRA